MSPSHWVTLLGDCSREELFSFGSASDVLGKIMNINIKMKYNMKMIFFIT